jgi:hypothetical protein
VAKITRASDIERSVSERMLELMRMLFFLASSPFACPVPLCCCGLRGSRGSTQNHGNNNS